MAKTIMLACPNANGNDDNACPNANGKDDKAHGDDDNACLS